MATKDCNVSVNTPTGDIGSARHIEVHVRISRAAAHRKIDRLARDLLANAIANTRGSYLVYNFGSGQSPGYCLSGPN